jgi:SPP1 family predicted phage head-tail adaptor
MQSGRLRQRVTVRNLIETQSTITGELVRTWSTVLDGVWASVEPLQGREYFAASQFQSRIDTKVTLRYSTVNITPKMTVHNGTHIYNIETVINPELRNREIQLMCFERIAT